jgi:hypothetical protein
MSNNVLLAHDGSADVPEYLWRDQSHESSGDNHQDHKSDAPFPKRHGYRGNGPLLTTVGKPTCPPSPSPKLFPFDNASKFIPFKDRALT